MDAQDTTTLNFTRFSLVGSSCSGQPDECFVCGGAAFLAEQSAATFVHGPFRPTPGFPELPLFASKIGMRLSISVGNYSKTVEPVGDNQDQVDSSETLTVSGYPPSYLRPPFSRTAQALFLKPEDGGVAARIQQYVEWNSTTARANSNVPSATWHMFNSTFTDNSAVYPAGLVNYRAFAPLGNGTSQGERRPEGAG